MWLASRSLLTTALDTLLMAPQTPHPQPKAPASTPQPSSTSPQPPAMTSTPQDSQAAINRQINLELRFLRLPAHVLLL
ncbi:hypothetical protein QTO34_006911 [Cnephaeus nilssonii]|uniref:Uncharacterized protein n=1 Tax=Cnephaeus nilssonii TaxID=3371016 RepID=A0AA40HJ97_CNENI|nr:hypothetical protein QTO34_006911 [Eptesicus nilssonii]